MKNRILDYLKQIDTLLEQPPEGTDWDVEIREHLTQIAFFQHERLIHLMVTIIFALLTMMSLIAMIVSFHMSLVILMVPLVILLFPYISHYYLLENSVQKMYEQYDQMESFRRNR